MISVGAMWGIAVSDLIALVGAEREVLAVLQLDLE
jgi:hypothetical protein